MSTTVEQTIQVDVPIAQAYDTTRVAVQMDWAPEGIKEKIGSALGLDDGRVKGDLERFKDFIESRGSETGAWRGEVPRER